MRDSRKLKEIRRNGVASSHWTYSSQPREAKSYQFNKIKRLHKCRDTKLAYIFKTADEIDCPLNIAITISWDALIQAGERNEGHILGDSPRRRQAKLFRRFRYLSKSCGRDLSYVWVSDVGVRFGEHLHIALFWPRYDIKTLSWLCAALLGSGLDESWEGQPKGFRSVCGGWMLRFAEPRTDLRFGWAKYMSDQVIKHNSYDGGRCFGHSRNLK